MATARAPDHVCNTCGYRTAKWLGRCPECGAWGTLEPAREPVRSAAASTAPAATRTWSDIDGADAARLSSGVGELDRVLGGGLVAGLVGLVGGEPGIGKSTLLLQSAAAIAVGGQPVLYVSAEESAAQLRSRGERLGVGSARLHVATDAGVEALLAAATRLAPALIVIDSIQAVRVDALDAAPGSVSQVRAAAALLAEHAKRSGTPVLLVGHVTKDGALAGPRVLEHLVDAVLQFEGDRFHDHRILRALKNRFGPTGELGVFRMTAAGMVEVPDASGLLLAERPLDAPGSAVVAAIEGTRPLLVEVQALAGEPVQGTPRRTVLGVEPHRVALILAVLERRCGIELARRDVFVNVPGGVALREPGTDLAVAAAVASSAAARPLPQRTVLCGEIGLAGEVRSIGRLDARLREAARLGFLRALVPGGGERPSAAIRATPVPDVEALLRQLWAEPRAASD